VELTYTPVPESSTLLLLGLPTPATSGGLSGVMAGRELIRLGEFALLNLESQEMRA